MATTIRILLTALFLFGPGIAFAEPAGDAYALIVRARTALGGEAWGRPKILHATMGLACGGLDGQQESWADPLHGRYAERYQLGPDRGAQGWNGHVAWSVDATGRVHELERGNAGDIRAIAFWSSFGFLLADRTGMPAEAIGQRREGSHVYDLIKLTQPGVRSFELWVDDESALPARLVVRGVPDLVVTYADYRVTGAGLKLPFRITISDGLTLNDQRLDIGRVDVEEMQADPFAVPASGTPDYQFASNAGRSVSELTPTGTALVVDVMIDGHGPFPFALDTGARNTLDSGLATELGLAVSGKFSGRGAGELPADLGLTRAPSVEIGDVRLSDQLFRVLPLASLGVGSKLPYRGLLGFEIFDRFVVRVDQDSSEVVLSDPAKWSYRGGVTPIAFHLHGHMPAIEGVIDMVPGRFTLDTGQANSLTLYRPFMVRTGIEHKYVPKMSIVVGEGIGGSIRAEVTRGERLTLGNANLRLPVIYLSLQRNGTYNDPELAGNVGGGMFLRYNTTFDYAHRLVYFERAAAYSETDSLGLMTVKRMRDGLKVLSVLPGGAVADAGLRPDDLIERINNRDAASIDYLEVQRMFRRPAGTKVEMSVRSEGQLKDLVIILTEAI
ncbi:MAG TPA: aspartyl protease family protein [Aliidongia sp.]|nr:aspartyl protease family protein [Aliidongia sp.]